MQGNCAFQWLVIPQRNGCGIANMRLIVNSLLRGVGAAIAKTRAALGYWLSGYCEFVGMSHGNLKIRQPEGWPVIGK
jgi:hypothetical protein